MRPSIFAWPVELSSLAGEELLVAVEDALLSGLLVERTVSVAGVFPWARRHHGL